MVKISSRRILKENKFTTRISPSHKSSSASIIDVTGLIFVHACKLKESLLPSGAPPS